MTANAFIRELQSLICDFEKKASEYGKLDECGPELTFDDIEGYPFLEMEVNDGNKIITCKQKFEIWDEDCHIIRPHEFTHN